MTNTLSRRPLSRSATRMRLLSERALARTAGAPLITGNAVKILKDATENYPAWLAAINAAQKKIYFECYIIHEDDQGEKFSEALIAKAQAGVKVRLIYDWVGGFGSASRKFWRRLMAGGVDVRCFNPPHLDSPFGWLGRDHRKMLAIDGEVAFVTGLCVGRMWVGDPSKGIDPWRDTGVEVRGPAVAEIERSFTQMWATIDDPLPHEEMAEIKSLDDILPAGDVSVRVIASIPSTGGLYRLDQMVAASARDNIWLTDAYFAATTPYLQALRAAAFDGVDVRLLVPQATDIPVMRALSRSGYRTLLEAGVRVFEWNGPMVHAKTAVFDGRWARVGSTNLNIASWLSNWELDLVVEDNAFGKAMERMYLQDLENATEILLTAKRKPVPSRQQKRRKSLNRLGVSNSGPAAAGALRIGKTVGASIVNWRMLAPAEAQALASGAVFLLLLSVVAVIWPRWITIPLAVIGIWVALSLLLRAFELHREGKREEKELREKGLEIRD